MLDMEMQSDCRHFVECSTEGIVFLETDSHKRQSPSAAGHLVFSDRSTQLF